MGQSLSFGTLHNVDGWHIVEDFFPFDGHTNWISSPRLVLPEISESGKSHLKPTLTGPQPTEIS